MSLYNLMHEYNTACILFLPMLGRRYDEYPRFRDCFISEDGKHIDIYTRVGGNNRESGYGEEVLYEDENFVTTFDDDYDNTYGTYRFKVPDKWLDDYNYIVEGEFSKVSDEYVNIVKSFYPKLTESGLIDAIFKRSTVNP